MLNRTEARNFVKEMLESVNFKMTEDVFESIFCNLDVDKDENITFEELYAYLEQLIWIRT